jgi:hypothetical protein
VESHPHGEFEVAEQRHELSRGVGALEDRRALSVAHPADDGVAMLDVERAPLQRNEDDLRIEPVHHEVGGVGQEAVVVLHLEVGSRRPRLPDGETDEPRIGIDRLREPDLVQRERLRLQEHRGIGRDDDLPLDADLLQELPRVVVADRDRRRRLEPVAHAGAHGRLHQRAGADRVGHDRRSRLVGEEHVSEIHLRVGIVENAAAAQDQEIERLMTASASLLGMPRSATMCSTRWRRWVSGAWRENTVISTGAARRSSVTMT